MKQFGLSRPLILVAGTLIAFLGLATVVLARGTASIAGLGAALVLVTHDAELAARCDRRLHLDNGKLTEAAS